MRHDGQGRPFDLAPDYVEPSYCKVCNRENDYAELCQPCADKLKAEGYDPFFQTETCGKDLR
jgi:hypothetical protein